MERAEAEAILDGDREVAIGLLFRLDELAAANERLVAANERLEARVAELERRLNRSSRNSSLPPSQDPPSVPPRSRGEGSGRARGGQPGHEGRYRRLLPAERVDEVVEYWPERCRGCGELFAATAGGEGDPSAHQVAELPALAVRVVEHRLHRRRCGCGLITRAELPSAVSRSSFGPRLQAAVASLATRQRLSRRQIVELTGELFGCPLSLGAVDAIIARVGAALEPAYNELRSALAHQPVVHADETGWALAGARHWLWGGFTPSLAVLAINKSRGQKAAKELLGERPAGIVCTDRYCGYNHLPPEQRQLCWAHLDRDFKALSERHRPADKKLGRALLRIADGVFAAYDDYRNHSDPARLRRELESTQRRLRTLLEPVARGRREHTAALAADLLARWPSLWRFLDQPDLVEPTNNSAERGLRPAVIKRKLSFGSASEHGLRTTERLLSADGTCRRQGRGLFHYLAETLTATTLGHPTPSLIPP